MDQDNRPKPAMGDIRPRRSMDMGRPSGAPMQPMPQASAQRPVPQRPLQQAPIQQPQTAPTQRPQPLPPRPMPLQRPVAQRPTPAQGQQYAGVPEQQFAQAPAEAGREVKPQKAAKPPKVRKERPFWRGFLQVIVSLLVIVGVAAVIVALYLRYYQ